jgi:DNA-binding response OmpR family regulator
MPNQKAKILLVEDEKSLSEMYQTKLEKEGFEVLAVDNGENVALVAAEKNIDLILLDIILPKVDGFAALKELKENAKTKKIPVVMLTNLGQDEDIKKGKQLGAEDYWVKSNLTPSQVADKIKGILKIK